MYYPWVQILLAINASFLLADIFIPEKTPNIFIILSIINLVYSFVSLAIENKKRGLNFWTGRKVE